MAGIALRIDDGATDTDVNEVANSKWRVRDWTLSIVRFLRGHGHAHLAFARNTMFDFEWDCPSRGTLVAVTGQVIHGRIQQTPDGYATFDGYDNRIGCFPDFISAESALARHRPKHSNVAKVRRTDIAGTAILASAATMAGVIACSLLAIATA